MRIEIITIIAPCLYSVAYAKAQDEELLCEYDELLKRWSSTQYWFEAAKALGITNRYKIKCFVSCKLSEVRKIDDTLIRLAEEGGNLAAFFKPLSENERSVRGIAREKAKVREYRGLRLYALRIEPESRGKSPSYVITGGALKTSKAMQDAPETLRELEKLEEIRKFLHENGIEDNGTLYDWLIEED